MRDEPLGKRSLQLTRPFGGTILLALVGLTLLLGVTELAFRSTAFQTRLAPSNMGSRHYQLGPKLSLLEAAIEQYGHIDCIFVGNSMVDLGLDPVAFAEAYFQATGETIRCFNFGIDGVPAAGSGALAQILVQDYQPKLLIFATDARDYAAPIDSDNASVILDTEWIQYRLGTFSFEGWLIEHTQLFRYKAHLSRLSRFVFEDLDGIQLNQEITQFGQTPYSTIGENVNEPPDMESSELGYYYTLLTNYEIHPENLDGLARIVKQQELGVNVIVVEMPVPAGYFYFFGNGREDYQRFLDNVAGLARQSEVPFWPTTSLQLVPENGWVDYSHLNKQGAMIFSSWLGRQVGKMHPLSGEANVDQAGDFGRARD